MMDVDDHDSILSVNSHQFSVDWFLVVFPVYIIQGVPFPRLVATHDQKVQCD